MTKKNTLIIDKIGICTSVICILHCLAMPIFLILGLDSLLLVLDQEWVELTIILLALIIGVSAFGRGFARHRQHFVPVLFIAGFLLLVNGESVENTWLKVGLSVAGAMVVAYAHYHNFLLKKKTKYYS